MGFSISTDFISATIRKGVTKLASLRFVRRAISEEADLTAFRQLPTFRVIVGVSAIGISYILAWPLITVLGIVAVRLEMPAIILIGGPVAYGLSHLVFLLGMYLAGAKYSVVFLRWLTRVGVLKLMALTRTPLSPDLPPEHD
ncbi:hypothetical protein LJC71_02275 [Desulfosarcina sp. OttesenSCG-928-A07]|nr:hypothetical protein [Desulfosarcina sp. OttesenSCG-928-G17]MDL2328565.1 hypothetical protein [Desulfosarcina sp. OttesenSCG-928-A07]